MNKQIDQGNKKLRRSHKQDKYVIVLMRDGVDKYVARGYWDRYNFQYTVKLESAMIFYNLPQALEFMAKADKPDARIQHIIVTTELAEEVTL